MATISFVLVAPPQIKLIVSSTFRSVDLLRVNAYVFSTDLTASGTDSTVVIQGIRRVFTYQTLSNTTATN